MNAVTQNASELCDQTREVFSVEGVRVTLDAWHGWRCTCTASRADIHCAHIEQARGLRRMREERRTAETMELELSAEQLRVLSDGLAADPDAPPDEDVPAPPTRKVSPSHWATLVAAAVAISGVSSAITYVAVSHEEPTQTYAQLSSESPAAPDPPPAQPEETQVHFVNPFDATEVFQFPAGTTETSAREAVAELLLKRAQERLAVAGAARSLRIAQTVTPP